MPLISPLMPVPKYIHVSKQRISGMNQITNLRYTELITAKSYLTGHNNCQPTNPNLQT